MLQSKNITRLLVQLLEPVPEVTSSVPVCISLVSRESSLPLVSCVSKSSLEENSEEGLESAEMTGETTGETIVNSSGGAMNVSGSGAGVNGGSPELSTSARIRDLQQKITEMDENYDSNYIEANPSPGDNLSIVSTLCLKSYDERAQSGATTAGSGSSDPWMLLKCNEYIIVVYEVNEEYAVLLCCHEDYPSGFAVKRLESLCGYLKGHLST